MATRFRVHATGARRTAIGGTFLVVLGIAVAAGIMSLTSPALRGAAATAPTLWGLAGPAALGLLPAALLRGPAPGHPISSRAGRRLTTCTGSSWSPRSCR